MFIKTTFALSAVIILSVLYSTGCSSATATTEIPPSPAATQTIPVSPTGTNAPAVTPLPPTPDFSAYAFPASIDPAKEYLFYLHGKIIEDQGIPATSPEYGEYAYKAILEKLGENGYVVISEQRPKNADGMEYARKAAGQVRDLLEARVPAKHITVVGASKGAGIAVYVSHFLENREINYVILAICHPDRVKEFIQGQIFLFGNVLSIYDSVDDLAGSCQELFAFSEGRGLARREEIVLNIGAGHGILYQPLDEWLLPTAQWARKP